MNLEPHANGNAESVMDAAPADQIEVRPVPSAMVAAVWPHVSEMLELAVEAGNGDRLAQDYLSVLLQAHAQLWLVLIGRKLTAAVVTQIAVYPRRKVCRVELMAGEALEKWLPEAAKVITRWAREVGCPAIDCPVRPGLVRVMRKIGFRETHRIIRLRLDQ